MKNREAKEIQDIVAEIVVRYYSQFKSMHEDLTHTQEVVTYTRMIAIEERLPDAEVAMLEAAAWLHDIGCPRSKEIFGNSLPSNQQRVGREVTYELLHADDRISTRQRDWLIDVVGSHHQIKSSTALRFTPLFEADLIVNILSGYYEREKADHLFDTMMTSNGGKKLFRTLIKKAEPKPIF